MLLICMVPDLGKADGRVEAEVDKKWHAQVEHDIPREDAVELHVERDYHCLADLKHADHPEGQVAH